MPLGMGILVGQLSGFEICKQSANFFFGDSAQTGILRR